MNRYVKLTKAEQNSSGTTADEDAANLFPASDSDSAPRLDGRLEVESDSGSGTDAPEDSSNRGT